jgi:UrcA family protein
MNTNTFTNCTLQAAIAVLGLAVAPAMSYGQQTTDVTIQAPQTTHDRQPIGRLGAWVPAVSASRRVSYADLDVSTYSGATALVNRVRDAAKSVCKYIAVEESASTDGDPPCVKGAMQVGMQRARLAIAAAEARAKTRGASTTIAANDVGEHR